MDWDGTSCDLADTGDDTSHLSFARELGTRRQQTLLFMFLVSLVVAAVSVVVKTRTASRLRTLESTSKHGTECQETQPTGSRTQDTS